MGTSDQMSDEIRSSVIEILALQAVRDPSELELDQTIEALGIDSLGVVEVIFAIEERFDISVPFNANAPSGGGFDISSVGAIVAAVEQLIADQKS